MCNSERIRDTVVFKSGIFLRILILGVVKRNPLFLHEIEWKNNGFLFTTPNKKKNKYYIMRGRII